MLQKLKRLLIGVTVTLGLAGVLWAAAPGYAAAAATTCPQGWEHLASDDRVCCPSGSGSDATECIFAKYINPSVKILAAAAGVAVIIGIILGGIQYASSAGDPQKAAAGKTKVMRALYGLLAFLFLYSALQFLTPGGLAANATPSGKGRTIAAQCSKPFLGLQPWFAYLPDEAFDKSSGSYTCNINNFSLFGDSGTGTGSHLLPVALVIADDLLRLAGLVAVVFVMVGGVQYVTSEGEPDRTKRAKDSIINALIGLAIAIVAAAVVSYIGRSLT